MRLVRYIQVTKMKRRTVACVRSVREYQSKESVD